MFLFTFFPHYNAFCASRILKKCGRLTVGGPLPQSTTARHQHRHDELEKQQIQPTLLSYFKIAQQPEKVGELEVKSAEGEKVKKSGNVSGEKVEKSGKVKGSNFDDSEVDEPDEVDDSEVMEEED